MVVKPKRKTNSRHPISWLVPSLGFFRVFRALRPLRSLNAVPQMKAKDKIQGNKHQQMLGGIPSKKHGSDFFSNGEFERRNFSEKKRACHSFSWVVVVKNLNWKDQNLFTFLEWKWYCWWTKSQTTTWDGFLTPINNGDHHHPWWLAGFWNHQQ